jgi:LmbE family N-acetylglucosaminyl deacetylase
MKEVTMSLIPWYHPTPQSLLVVAPHPDDEVIGCGGLLASHSRIGGESTVLYLTCSEQKRWQEAIDARSHLAIAHAVELNLPEGHVRATEQTTETVRELLRKIKPGTITLPSTGDPHPDHRSTHAIFSEALSIVDDVDTEILLYEGFTPICNANAWLDITPVAHQKWAALACYESQQERYRIVEIARHLNAFRAITSMRKHVHYAEAFRRLTVSEYLNDRRFVLMSESSSESDI